MFFMAKNDKQQIVPFFQPFSMNATGITLTMKCAIENQCGLLFVCVPEIKSSFCHRGLSARAEQSEGSTTGSS